MGIDKTRAIDYVQFGGITEVSQCHVYFPIHNSLRAAASYAADHRLPKRNSGNTFANVV